MRATTKSALRLAREALAVGRASLEPYASRFSKHSYTQPQLFAMLVLRQFLKVDYRGFVVLLGEWADLRRTLGIRKVPHYSTLCYAERRLLSGAEKGGPLRLYNALPSPGRARRVSSERTSSQPSTPRASRHTT
jgi:hypothetical protein